MKLKPPHDCRRRGWVGLLMLALSAASTLTSASRSWLEIAPQPPSNARAAAFVGNDAERGRKIRGCRGHRPPRRIAERDPVHFRTTAASAVTLDMGRERRFSHSKSRSGGSSVDQHRTQQSLDVTQCDTPEEQKFREKEALARTRRIGQLKQRFDKAVRREDRILFLEAKFARERQQLQGRGTTVATEATASIGENSDVQRADTRAAEEAELRGLLRVRDSYEECYDPLKFSEDHLAFKALHNDVFARLVRWCEEQPRPTEERRPAPSVFFLDGPDGGTASSLIGRNGFSPAQCYVANRHASTCAALRRSGGGPLPDGNVVHATCSEALTKGGAAAADESQRSRGDLAHIAFAGYYFDGCSGYVPHIINMMSAALLKMENDCDDSGAVGVGEHAYEADERHRRALVVGYSLLGGTKSVVEKELEVSRALTTIARTRGMRLVHALDDPSRFGLPPGVSKLGGGSNDGGTTFTTWLILEPEYL